MTNRTAEDIRADIDSAINDLEFEELKYLDKNKVFNVRLAEELDWLTGALGDDRRHEMHALAYWFESAKDMKQADELFEKLRLGHTDMIPRDVEYDEDTYEPGPFDMTCRYFYWDAYGHFVSTDVKDYEIDYDDVARVCDKLECLNWCTTRHIKALFEELAEALNA